MEGNLYIYLLYRQLDRTALQWTHFSFSTITGPGHSCQLIVQACSNVCCDGVCCDDVCCDGVCGDGVCCDGVW